MSQVILVHHVRFSCSHKSGLFGGSCVLLLVESSLFAAWGVCSLQDKSSPCCYLGNLAMAPPPGYYQQPQQPQQWGAPTHQNVGGCLAEDVRRLTHTHAWSMWKNQLSKPKETRLEDCQVKFQTKPWKNWMPNWMPLCLICQ